MATIAVIVRSTGRIIGVVDDNNHIRPRTYSETCDAAASAIEMIYKKLLMYYNIRQVKKAFAKNKIKHVLRIDATSVLLVMVPINEPKGG